MTELPQVEKNGWLFTASPGFDALCLVNIFTSNPVYRETYKEDFERWSTRFTEEKDALAALDEFFTSRGEILSAALCLLFSAIKVSTLDELIDAVQHPEDAMAAFAKTPWGATHAELVERSQEQVLPHLAVVLNGLKRAGYDQDWDDRIRPLVESQIDNYLKEVPEQKLLVDAERYLGFPLPDPIITVIVLFYGYNHGMKLAGSSFTTNVWVDTRRALQIAVHEMLHPPVDKTRDADLWDELLGLSNDPFIQKTLKVAKWYRQPEEFVEENIVQALDQVLCEAHAVSMDARERWKIWDGGMHVLAPVVYELLREKDFETMGVASSEFLRQMLEGGELVSGQIKERYDAFYGGQGPWNPD